MSEKSPGQIVLDFAWGQLHDANSAWNMASWAPAQPYNSLSYLYEAMGAYRVAEMLKADPDKLKEFYDAWWKLRDEQEKRLNVKYVQEEHGTPKTTL